MHIEFSLQESDLIALAHYQISQSPLVPRRIRQKRIAYAFGFGLLALATSLAFPDPTFSIVFALMSVLALLVYEPFAKRRLHAAIPGLVRARMTPASLGPRHLRALPDGLEEESPQARTRVKWASVGPIEDTPTHAFVSVDGVYALVIPVDRVTAGDLASFLQSVAKFQGAAV